MVNLIELEDVSILLVSLELEPNKYTQLRLFLKSNEEEDAWIVAKKGVKSLFLTVNQTICQE